MRDSGHVRRRMGGAVDEVYCLAPRSNLTETTRGPGIMHFQILMRSSEGSPSNKLKDSRANDGTVILTIDFRACVMFSCS